MQNRVVEISSDGAHLSVSRGFLSVKIDGEIAGQVAIEDMSALIIRGHGASLSVNICERLSQANVPIVICSANQSPASVVWPVSGHFAQGLNMQAQAEANKPLKKRLWAQLVKGKILAQVDVLSAFQVNSDDLKSLAARVKSGDSDNVEVQAARRYWPRLLGDGFTRGTHQGGKNAALNYGYTVLRAAVARSILGAGLHPSLSVQHQSRGDALRLADDLMEPFRPWVDYTVRKIAEDFEGDFELVKAHKEKLVAVLTLDLQGPQGASPMQVCMDRLAQSLAQVFFEERKALEMPGPPLPITLSGVG